MSLLPPEIHQAVNQLLIGLQASDNIVRTQAEESLNSEWIAPRAEVLLMALAEQILGAEEIGTRSFAAVLFRRVASKTRKAPGNDGIKDLFLTIPAPERQAIQEKLLQALSAETSQSVRFKISDALAEVARQYTEEGLEWGELLGALFTLSQSADSGQRETAFRIFTSTPGIIKGQHEGVLHEAFGKGFKDPDNSVKVAAVEAFGAFFRSLIKKQQQKYFDLVADLLNILPPLKDAKDSEDLSSALMPLIDLAEASPKMFKGVFNSLVNFSISVIQDKELTDVARQNALELLATFAENSPGMCRKDPQYTSEMVTQCLSLMTDVGEDDDDAQNWLLQEDLDADDSDNNNVAGEQCMDRLANKLGGATLLPPTFNWLPRMMTSSAWRDRHAALMAISAISEGCRDLMLVELDKVLDLVLPALRDAHPRVRWAGCNALGQMSTDFAPSMQEKYHQIVLPSIIPVLRSPEPRVQSHAAAALVNFCEEAEKTTLEPYLDELLTNLLGLLESPKRYVQEQALSTIATVADSAESAFGKYYDKLMPLLFLVLEQEQGEELRLLSAKAMECATLIALAVGKERMAGDAMRLVKDLATIQGSITDDADPRASYLLHCWGRMCRVLGQEFVPFLADVIRPLAEMASAKADLQLLDDEDTKNQILEEEGWELVPLKGKHIAIKTSVLDDKNMAIELIVIYAQVLQEAFEPYVNEIMDKIALPSLAFFFHDPVRVSAAKCVPALLTSYKKAHGTESTQLGALWERTVEKVIEVLSTEPTIDTLSRMYECFYECVECMGKNCMTVKHMEDFCKAAEGVLGDYVERVKERKEDENDREDGEEPDEETLFAIEDDQELLSEMNKAIHTIFKNVGVAFLPFWQNTLLPFCQSFSKAEDPTQRQWVICIYDDMIEFCGADAFRYSQQIIQPIVDGMQDDYPANRQAAVYGVGVMAHKGGGAWNEIVSQSLPLLFQVCQRPDARKDDDVYATENASAAIAKILHFSAPAVPNWQEVAAAWIDTLPIVNDDEAAPYGYSFLVQLIEQQNPVVMTQAAKCFGFVAQALEADTLTGSVKDRVIAAAKQLVHTAGLSPDQLLAGLAPETQQTVRTYFG